MILKEASNNPFRILGLYSDCTLKQQAANLSKLQAFATVQKQTDMPGDMTKIYGPADRSTGSLKQADEQLRNADERLLAALLWWPEPTEPWMQSVMEQVGNGTKANLPDMLEGQDNVLRMRELLALLQASILQDQWETLPDVVNEIADGVDVLKNLVHCSTAAADSNQIRQYVYGLLEREGVPIRTISITQRIASLVTSVNGIDHFHTLQLLYYQLEEFTSDQDLLQRSSDRIAMWVVRNSKGLQPPQYDEIRRILKESFKCSRGVRERLDDVYFELAQTAITYVKKANKSGGNGCLYTYLVWQFFLMIMVFRSCMGCGSKEKKSITPDDPLPYYRYNKEYYENELTKRINNELLKEYRNSDSIYEKMGEYDLMGISYEDTSSVIEMPEIAVFPDGGNDDDETEDNQTSE